MGGSSPVCRDCYSFTCGFGRMSEYSSGERGHLRSATYYSDDWVINFWNSESVHMEEELARIAADGFNSIILAVPWREFQAETAPVMYEEYALEEAGACYGSSRKTGIGSDPQSGLYLGLCVTGVCFVTV